MADKERYTVKEISQATGIRLNLVSYRIKMLKLENPVPYEDVLKIINYKSKVNRSSPKRVDKLKLQLRNDGYQVGK